MEPAIYYRRLQRVRNCITDWIAYRNAHLLKEGFCDQDQRVVRVYTDVTNVMLTKLGDGPTRIQHLGVIVSVVAIGRTHYVLAAHPYFLPAALAPNLTDLERDKQRPDPLGRRWEGLVTFLDKGSTLSKDGSTLSPQLPDEGLGGHLVRPRFGALAHFLVVNKMLARFKGVHYYMDTAAELHGSAVVAMREDVQKGRVEIALFQSEKGKKKVRRLRKKGARVPPTVGLLKSEFNRMDAMLDEHAGRELAKAGGDLRRARARVWRLAAKGSEDPDGGYLWLDFPPEFVPYPQCSTLWLTRQPTQTVEDAKDLFFEATLQPVDATHASMRARNRGFTRPLTTAERAGGSERGVRNLYYDPEVAAGELAVYFLFRNFRKWRRDPKDKIIGAVAMGVMRKDEPQPVPGEIFWDFRLSADHAREVSRWMPN